MRQISLANSKCLKRSEILNNSQLSVSKLSFSLGEADNKEKIGIHVVRPIRNMKVELFLRIVLNGKRIGLYLNVSILVPNILLLSKILLR